MRGAIVIGVVGTSISTLTETSTPTETSIAINTQNNSRRVIVKAVFSITRNTAKAFPIATRGRRKNSTGRAPMTQLNRGTSFADEPNRAGRISAAAIARVSGTVVVKAGWVIAVEEAWEVVVAAAWAAVPGVVAALSAASIAAVARRDRDAQKAALARAGVHAGDRHDGAGPPAAAGDPEDPARRALGHERVAAGQEGDPPGHLEAGGDGPRRGRAFGLRGAGRGGENGQDEKCGDTAHDAGGYPDRGAGDPGYRGRRARAATNHRPE